MLKQTLFPVLLITLVLGSCTTAYKTGQTPDDVYYSPARTQDEYVRMDREEESRYYSDDFYDDRYLRMRLRNRTRWSELDDWYWNERRFRYNVFVGNGIFGYDPWSPFHSWNNWYNPYFHPYFTPVFVSQPRVVYSRPRTFNLNTYSGTGGNTAGTINTNPKFNTGSGTRPTNPTYNSGRTTSGSVLRNIFGGGGSSSGSSGSNGSSGTRTSSGSSGSSGSSSGSSAPVRRF